jgi:hypothetical protein
MYSRADITSIRVNDYGFYEANINILSNNAENMESFMERLRILMMNINMINNDMDVNFNKHHVRYQEQNQLPNVNSSSSNMPKNNISFNEYMNRKQFHSSIVNNQLFLQNNMNNNMNNNNQYYQNDVIRRQNYHINNQVTNQQFYPNEMNKQTYESRKRCLNLSHENLRKFDNTNSIDNIYKNTILGKQSIGISENIDIRNKKQKSNAAELPISKSSNEKLETNILSNHQSQENDKHQNDEYQNDENQKDEHLNNEHLNNEHLNNEHLNNEHLNNEHQNDYHNFDKYDSDELHSISDSGDDNFMKKDEIPEDLKKSIVRNTYIFGTKNNYYIKIINLAWTLKDDIINKNHSINIYDNLSKNMQKSIKMKINNISFNKDWFTYKFMDEINQANNNLKKYGIQILGIDNDYTRKFEYIKILELSKYISNST